MKILFPYMARWYSLNWSRYHSLLIALAQRGHEVIVLQPPSLQSQETNFVEIAPVPVAGLQVLDVAVPGWIWRRKWPFDKLVKKALVSLCSVRQARRIVREQNVSHVLLYNIPQAPLASVPGAAMVFDFADDYMDMLRHELGRLSNPLLIGLAQKLLDHMFRRASLVTTVSHVLAHGSGHEMTVLPNGVSTAKVSAVPATPAFTRGGRPVVGFLGSFEYFIDFDLILEAAQQLPEVDFLLVGKGRDYAHVVDEVARRGLKNVELVGGVPHAEVFKQIDRMDICLNTFRKIPVSERACPIKLFEYAAMRKPIISTRLAEMPHVDKGFLYYADTAAEAVACVRAMLADPQTARARADQGYEHVMANYTWEKIADDFAAVAAGLAPRKA